MGRKKYPKMTRSCDDCGGRMEQRGPYYCCEDCGAVYELYNREGVWGVYRVSAHPWEFDAIMNSDEVEEV